MKAEELKLFNWIYRKYGNPTVMTPNNEGLDPVRVVGVLENDIWVDIGDGKLLKYSKEIFDDLVAIPLTAEILKSAGFEFEPLGYNDFNLKGSWRFPHPDFNLDLSHYNDDSFTYDWDGYCTELEHVHKLQNLFHSLTENHLQITL